MRKILINIGERSKQAFAQPINTYKKNKVLSDYLKMIKKNKHLILKENKKDVDWANKIKLRDNLINRLILNEKRIVLLYNYEPALQTGFSTIKTAKFDLGEEKPSNFQFNISKVKFFGESRVFAWHKKAGFIRID